MRTYGTMRGFGVFIMLGLIATQITFGANASVVHVSRFGAKVNDGKSDTEAIRAALAVCANEKGVRLVFEKGTYDLYARAHLRRTGEEGMHPISRSTVSMA